MATKDGLERFMERIGPVGIAEEVPPQSQRPASAEQLATSGERHLGVDPMERRGGNDEIESLGGQVDGLEGADDHPQRFSRISNTSDGYPGRPSSYSSASVVNSARSRC